MPSKSFLKTKYGTYVYESESYWDKDLQKVRTKKTYLGKLDDNGEIVKTEPRKKKADIPDGEISAEHYRKLSDDLEKARNKISDLESSIAELKRENQKLRAIIARAVSLLSGE